MIAITSGKRAAIAFKRALAHGCGLAVGLSFPPQSMSTHPHLEVGKVVVVDVRPFFGIGGPELEVALSQDEEPGDDELGDLLGEVRRIWI
jgi:hypothetical protein